MSRIKDIDFNELLLLIQELPEEKRLKIFWSLRKQEAFKNSSRLDEMIYNEQ